VKQAFRIVPFFFQDNSLDRLTIRSQNSLKLVDLGGNKLRSVPTGLLVHSARLRILYLDDNRLTNCSSLHTLDSASSPIASSRELVIDLSDNLITEPSKDCSAGRTTSIYLAGNPIYCGSCVTAQFIASMSSGGRRADLADRDKITCAGPSAVAGRAAFGTATELPGSWQCRWGRGVAIAIAVAFAAMSLVVCAVAVSRRRILANSDCCIAASRRRCRGRTISSATGSTSTVTINNGCYGNGSASEAAATAQPISSGIMAIGGCESGTTRYSPLVEDDGRQEFQTSTTNGQHFWHSAGSLPNRMSPSSVAEPGVVGDDMDGMSSSTADINCPLIGDGSHVDKSDVSFPSSLNGGVGNQRTRATATSGSAATRCGRNARGDHTGSAHDDMEDSL